MEYAEYKESGLPWLGKIPKHWDEQPGFAVFRDKQEKNTGLKEKRVLSLSYGRIVIKSADKLHGLVPDSFETYQIVNPGDVIIRSTDLQNDWTSLRVGLVHDRGIITSAYLCFKNLGSFTPEFAFLLLHSYDLQKFFYGLGSGLRQNLGFGDFKRLPFPIPSPDEQSAIVRFLGHANGRIERAIRAKQKLMALLNEQKQAIIHRAVTRGLDPTVPLKPSGIPWLGDIPKHWEVLRSKYVFREVDDRSTTGQETRLSMSQKLGLIPSSQIEVRRLMSESGMGMKICEQGDLVLNRLKAHLGVFALASERGLVSPDYTILRPARPMYARYFELLYRTPACRVELRKRAKGIVQGFWRLYTDDFYDIRVPVPPVPEQEKIVKQLDLDLAMLNTALARTEREIGLLREYRTRLVADVVTGKLDVRAAARQLPEAGGELSDEADQADGLDESDLSGETVLE